MSWELILWCLNLCSSDRQNWSYWKTLKKDDCYVNHFLIFGTFPYCIAYSCSSSVQSFSHAHLFATPWTGARQASLSITNSQSVLRLMSVTSVMPSNHPLSIFTFSIFPSIRVFLNESVLHIRWPKYWSFSFSTKLYIHCRRIPQIIFFNHFSSQWFSIHSRTVFKNLWYSQIFLSYKSSILDRIVQ